MIKRAPSRASMSSASEVIYVPDTLPFGTDVIETQVVQEEHLSSAAEFHKYEIELEEPSEPTVTLASSKSFGFTQGC